MSELSDLRQLGEHDCDDTELGHLCALAIDDSSRARERVDALNDLCRHVASTAPLTTSAVHTLTSTCCALLFDMRSVAVRTAALRLLRRAMVDWHTFRLMTAHHFTLIVAK